MGPPPGARTPDYSPIICTLTRARAPSRDSSYLGLPLSTTHCQVGATAGVALLEGFKGCNAYVLAKTCFGWVFTCFFVGFLAAIFTSIGAYAPNASGSLVGATPTVAFCNTSAIVTGLAGVTPW